MTTFHGFAVNYDGSLLNGARGRLRDPNAPIDLIVGHLWGSPEDGPGRYLNHLATPNLPGVSSRVFQSRDRRGRWLWERVDGSQTVDESAAKRWVGRPGLRVFRSGAAPLPLISGVTAFPWCFGAGYHGVAGVDGEPYWACDPQLVQANHAPPVNDRSVGFCLPGRYQTRHQWLFEGESRDFIRAFAKAIVWGHGRFGVPLVRVTEADLRRNPRARGYTDHVAVNNVWHQSDHGDLGSEFPWDVLAADIATIIEGDDMPRLCNIREIPPDWPTHPCVTHPGFYVDHGGVLEPVSAVDAAVRFRQKSIKGDPAVADTVSAIDRGTLGSYRLWLATTPHAPILATEFLATA